MNIKKKSINDVITQIHQLNPELGKEIEWISPGKDHYFYEVSYPYSTMILNKGVFQLPGENNQVVPLNH